MAGFQLSINGRFWVSTEVRGGERAKQQQDSEGVGDEEFEDDEDGEEEDGESDSDPV